MRPLVVVLLLALAPIAAEPPGILRPLAAQTISVRVQVSERTGGLLQARFDSAFRALDEVRVAGRSEPADYALDVSVLCVPESGECASAESFAVSIVLSEPVTPATLKSGLARTGEDRFRDWRASPEAAAYLQRFGNTHALWTTWWGTDRYGAEVDRLARSVNVRCFEKRRILKKMASVRGGAESAVAEAEVVDPYSEGDWLC